jgi:hypothetical protein
MVDYIKNEGHWIELTFFTCILVGFISGLLIGMNF